MTAEIVEVVGFSYQGNEVERLNTWLNPLGDTAEEGVPGVEQWMRSTLLGYCILLDYGIDVTVLLCSLDARTEQKVLKESARLAWQISPQLAIYLPARSEFILSISN